MCLMLDQNVAIEYVSTQYPSFFSCPTFFLFQVYTEKHVKNKLSMYKMLILISWQLVVDRLIVAILPWKHRMMDFELPDPSDANNIDLTVYH